MQTLFVLIFCAANAGPYPAGCQSRAPGFTTRGECLAAVARLELARAHVTPTGYYFCARREEI